MKLPLALCHSCLPAMAADTEGKFHAVAAGQRAPLFVDDKTHLAVPGHELVAGAIFEAIVTGGGKR